MTTTELAILNDAEQKELAFFENRMDQALNIATAASITLATCLKQIHEKRLYRAYGTFDQYCRDRWQKGRRWGYQLIEAAQVLNTLSDDPNVRHGAHSLPENERQIRPLTALPPDQQAPAWLRANEIAALEGVDTAARHVQQAIDEKSPEGIPFDLPDLELDPERLTDYERRNAIKYLQGQADDLGVNVVIQDPRELIDQHTMRVMGSSESPEWYTPTHVIDLVISLFDVISVDPCSNSHETPNVPAEILYTKDDDGLSQPWHGNVYMNPPYGDEIGPWVERMVNLYRAGEIDQAVALLPGRIDTIWFQPLYDYLICNVRGRIKFQNSEYSAPFPSVIVYLGADQDSFIETFKHIGPIVKRIA